MLKKYYFTLGQDHIRYYKGEYYDKDSVVEIEATSSSEARQKMVQVFRQKWVFQYNELPDLKWYPRGIIKLK
jgi:hypothetical protein